MLGLTLAAVSLAAPLFPQETPTFRVDVKLVTVIATVKDASGRPVGGFERDHFTLLAGGVPQKISVFERQTDRPLSVALLFDASLSVAKELKFERQAAIRFVRSLLGSGSHPGDRIAVYQFTLYVDEVQSYTRSLERLERALLSIRPAGGTSVYDALYLAAQNLERRDGRKVIVLITDGGDTTSSTTYHEALEAVQLADAVLYSIIVVPITADAGRNLGGENALRTLSSSTGGTTFRQYSEVDLEQAFRQIEQDLRVQYLLGFYPTGIPAGSGRFQRLEVTVDRPGVQVLARSGFFLPTEPTGTPEAQPAITVGGAPPRERPPAKPAPKKVQKVRKGNTP